ncbi:ABC transporter ATP-binding protein [Starkeya sp. ORNL1]|uniref:ABC transporter ATP-binding protein n=1 Tax=Starkeya sp. ORNL1 TaxID=2709380 RepID=UPI001463B1D7|nr:ABC transporter ATP-binding protein [Starkeya sp. ORNL1]QJP16237.1 ABC transporter ATP-binding protein [Starkeya sp. ORNL1]
MRDPLFFSLRDVGVAYRQGGGQVTALAGIDLDLAVGRRLALVGESGSGKSTLAMAIAGLLVDTAVTTGSLSFPALGAPSRPGRDVGVVFQNASGSLNPVLRIGDQVAEIIVAHRGSSWGAARARALELIDTVRIPQARQAMGRFPHEFSGGQRQRIAMAAALAVDPPFLIADEPTSALDTVVQRELVTLLDELVREQRLTLLFVTHDIALASELADEVAVLLRGRLVETGPAAQVLSRPSHPYTRALLATRLDLDTPRAARLLEMDTADFTVRRPDAVRRG